MGSYRVYKNREISTLPVGLLGMTPLGYGFCARLPNEAAFEIWSRYDAYPMWDFYQIAADVKPVFFRTLTYTN